TLGQVREGREEHLFVDLAGQELLGEVERPPQAGALLARGGRRLRRALERPDQTRDDEHAGEGAGGGTQGCRSAHPVSFVPGEVGRHAGRPGGARPDWSLRRTRLPAVYKAAT